MASTAVNMSTFLQKMTPSAALVLLVTALVLVIMTSLAISQFNAGSYSSDSESNIIARNNAISINKFEIVICSFSTAALVLAIITLGLHGSNGTLEL